MVAMGYSVDVYNTEGKIVSKVDLNTELFSDEKVNKTLIQEYLLLQQSNGRIAIANTKESSPFKILGIIGDEKIQFGNGIDVERGKPIYFIPDTGDTPSFSDLDGSMDWENSVEYTKAKAFGRRLEVPVYFPNETKDGCNELGNLYDANNKLLDNWQSLLTKENRKKLMEKGLFVPGVLSEGLFERLKEHLAAKCKQAPSVYVKNADDFYQKFAEAYTYSIADRMFHLTGDVDRNFFNFYMNT